MKVLLTYFVFPLLLLLSSTTRAQVCIPTWFNPCYSGGGASTNDLIDNFWTVGANVDILNMDSNCSPPGNYDVTGMVAEVCPGMEVEMNMQCEVEGSFAQGFAVWIDWNDNDTFEPIEKVYASPTASFAVYTGTFMVPGGISPGNYTMRVRCQYLTAGALIDPCAAASFGEAEDYIIEVGACDPTICLGDTTELDLGTLPPDPLTFSWSPDYNISDAFGGPIVEVWPEDTTDYICTITSPDSTWEVPFTVYVIHPANPFAGLDDTLCHSPDFGYPIDASIEVDEENVDIIWNMYDFDGGGSPSVDYDPDDDVLSPEISVEDPGTYQFIITVDDSYGYCPTQTDTISLTYLAPSHLLEATNPSCFGDTDGTITVINDGIIPVTQFSIDGGGTWQVENVFNDLPAGIYTITSMDDYGCQFESEIELIDPEPITIEVSDDTLICRNGAATIIASAEGGGGTYTYTWDIDGADDSDTQIISPTETPVVVNVFATDEFGCISESTSMEVTLRDPIALTITENDSICPGFTSGASVTATGGDGDYSYSWNGNGFPILDFDNTIVTTPTENTTYCVTVSDGCETTPVEICTETIINPVPNPSFDSDVTKGCNPATAVFKAYNNGFPIGTDDIAVWTIGDAVFNDYPVVSKEFYGVGFYDVKLHLTNEYGCENEITIVDYFESVAIPQPDFTINPNPTTIFNTKVLLNPRNNSDGDSYDWYMPSGSPETSTLEEPVVIYPEGVPGEYDITFTLTNDFGCSADITHTLKIVSDVIIYAPNAFTPDGDQFNDQWQVFIDGIDFYDFHCVIYNRWGEIVWESYNAAGTWDGTYGGNTAQDGTYVWVVQAKESTTDKKVEFNGTVTILR
ncbi:GEVED domain-containing protein [Crocinitomix algicola]|uniref:GEVED domain-containing protein n=1 Tax=Crocinitomix algicola TaxID=1740263 RepID=UPI0008361109|nr:GEVED domain-containing protein [Crocinitomix algicola]